MERPLRWAAILGICSLVFGGIVSAVAGIVAVSSLRSQITGSEAAIGNLGAFTMVVLVAGLLAALCQMGFYYGFVELAKRYKDGLLQTMGFILIVVALAGGILTAINVNSGSLDMQMPKEGTSQNQIIVDQYAKMPGFGMLLDKFGTGSLWVLIGLFFVGNAIIRILVGRAWLKRTEIKLAKLAGWFEIVGAILSIGTFVAMIMEIIIFFQEDKKPVSSITN